MSNGEVFLLIYIAVSILAGIIVFVSVYLASIEERGIVIGGSLGLIPAVIFGAVSILLWPIALMVFLVRRL